MAHQSLSHSLKVEPVVTWKTQYDTFSLLFLAAASNSAILSRRNDVDPCVLSDSSASSD